MGVSAECVESERHMAEWMPPDPERDAPESEETARNRRLVARKFWRKLLRVAGKIPFTDDLAAAYFCAMDRETPAKVKAVLMAALAYFVLPADLVPDIVAVAGFADDAAVLAAAISSVSRYIKPKHRKRAAEALGKTFDGEAEITINP